MAQPTTFANLSHFMRHGLQPVECPICQEEFGSECPYDLNTEGGIAAKISNRNTLVETSCSHRFHRGCLLDWMLGQRKRHCPYCKHELFPRATDTEFKVKQAEEKRQCQIEARREAEREAQREAKWVLAMNTKLGSKQAVSSTVIESDINEKEPDEVARRAWLIVQRELARVQPDDLNHPFARARARAWLREKEQPNR